MKATGEVMAIGRTFEESLLKAIDSLDIKFDYQLGLSLFEPFSREQLLDFMKQSNDQIVFAICKALQKGVTVAEIVAVTRIDEFFVRKLENIVRLAQEIHTAGFLWLDYDLYSRAKKIGFGDSYIANLAGVPLAAIVKLRRKFPVNPVFKIVDTCAGEFEAATPYFYSTYEETDDVHVSGRRKAPSSGPGDTDRSGNRVRLLQRPLSPRAPGNGHRVHHRQQQPRDRQHRLRHVRQALLRTAHEGVRHGRRPQGTPRGRDRSVRRPDRDQPGRAAPGRGRADPRHLGGEHRHGGGPRTLPAAPHAA
jgi:hypothetical protein